MAGRLTEEERADRRMTEAQLNSRVFYRARKFGWRVVRVQRASVGPDGTWRTPSIKGFPDLVLVRAGTPVLYRELKRELGRLEPEQREWIELLQAAGADAEVWRPSDLRLGLIGRELS